MARGDVLFQAFNRGILSKLGLGREDIDRTKLSAVTQENIIPRALGSAVLRPGTSYIGSTKTQNRSFSIPFVFNKEEQARLEITSGCMRVWVDDALVTRETVSATITDGEFTDASGNWIDNSDAGGSKTYNAGLLQLLGDTNGEGRAYQEVTIIETGTEHAFDITVSRGPVTLRIGTSPNDNTYLEAALGTGEHSLTVTPIGNAFITFANLNDRVSLVESIAVSSGDVLELAVPYDTDDLRKIRYDQSADVVYLDCDGVASKKIERRSQTSWSFVNYAPNDGPFRNLNKTSITLTPGALSGNTTLVSSANLFKSGHLGALFRLEHQGQDVAESFTAVSQETSAVRVTGVDNGRVLGVDIIPSSFVGTIKLRRSTASASGPWEDTGVSWTDPTATIVYNYDDEFDNQIIWYQLQVSAYTSGSADVALIFAGGTSSGTCRVTGVTDAQNVSIEVLEPFGKTDATDLWYEGVWSDHRGYPSANALYEGRLYKFSKNRIIGSEADNYENFSPDTEGDAGAINRTIGSGPVDRIAWALALQRLIVGTAGKEISVRATSFDEPLTPTDFNQKDASTYGSDLDVAAVKLDSNGVFIPYNGERLMLMSYTLDSNDYGTGDLTQLNPELLRGGVRRIQVQRFPDTRVHVLKEDGTAVVLLIDPSEDIRCFVTATCPGGAIEDVCILPGREEDQVYYTLKRTINGNTVRYHEKWAKESECVAGLNAAKLLDSHIIYSGAATATLTGLDHLEGESVRVYADGQPSFAEYTVSGGQITLPAAVSEACIGLGYKGRYKSTRLSYLSQTGSALGKFSKVSNISLLLTDVHWGGIRWGTELFDDRNDFEPMPSVINGDDVAATDYWDELELEMSAFNGLSNIDSRVCLQMESPFPCTVLSYGIRMETTD